MEKQNENKEKDLKGALFASPTPGEISVVCISPWNTANAPDNNITDFIPIFNEIKECGFNMIMLTYDGRTDVAVKTANLIGGLKAIIQKNSHVENSLTKFFNIIRTYRNNATVTAFNIWDEPSFSNLQDSEYKSEYGLCKLESGDKSLYFNLAYDFAGSNTEWNSRLDWVNSNYGPSIWSFDFYPMITVNGNTINRWEELYYYLEIFSNISRSTGKPFWSNVLCTEFHTNSDSRPYPTEAQMRYAAFTALAMGAQGIAFWHYTNRLPDGNEVYTNSPITNGVRTPIWYSLQNVINDINRYSYVFLNCIVDFKTYTTNTNLIVTPIQGPINTIVSSRRDLLMTQIHTNTMHYIVMVNMDVNNGVNVTLNFKSNYSTEYVWNRVTPNVPSSMNPSLEPDPNPYVKKVEIEAGGIAILEWK